MQGRLPYLTAGAGATALACCHCSRALASTATPHRSHRDTATETAREHQIVIVSYNILAKSLGSNCIPWVMVVSPELQRRVEVQTGLPWDQWKDDSLGTAYKQHFHKNFASGDYSTMRTLWSARHLQSAADLPASLTGLSFVAPDTVSYRAAETATARGSVPTVLLAKTMRGVLRELLPEQLASDLFAQLMEAEDTVYSWQARGPRILQAATNPPLGRERDGVAADIIALQEYDCHTSVANYRPGHGEETFHAAMGA